jgi:ribosomal 50S subunit-recycling heat shock protein
LITRRTVAMVVTDAGRVSINGRPAKASTDVKVGDILVLGFGAHRLEVEVLQVAEAMPAKDAKDMYKVLSDVTE